MQLIDADEICKMCMEELFDAIVETCEDCVVKDFKLNKAIEAEPVKHGRWVNNLEQAWQAFNCSICGESTDDTCMGKPRANYCPNCGAKMDLEG